MNVVWLKRDVRLSDHQCIALAARQSEMPIVLLYVYERCHLQSDTYHESHHAFINQGLAELDASVRAISDSGGGLTYRLAMDAVEALSSLHANMPIRNLYSHREVGNGISLDRDGRVASWAKEHGVMWTQSRQDGVSDIRHAMLDEGTWAKKWNDQMSEVLAATPTRLHLVDVSIVEPQIMLDALACGVRHTGVRPGAQTGGESHARATLGSFLASRGEKYSDELSSPLTGWDSCSRLSPYLAWGHISLRTVFQQLSQRQEAVRREKKSGAQTGGWLKSLAAHGSRLRWRSHFTQKLHDQPSIEFANMVSTYDELRVAFDEAKYTAWLDGRTGYPMVDACMRSLHHSGWLNFRMRCMLVSFACYQLWLDWKRLTPAMARLFLDYEPGIHYPQFQMQAGTTGINANRIYSPLKQAIDHAGTDFAFIRRWCQELAHVPNEHMAEPHKMPIELQQRIGCVIGVHYPPPVVDHAATYKHAVGEFARMRAQAETKAQSAVVYEKHGSRKRPSGWSSTQEVSDAKRPEPSPRARDGNDEECAGHDAAKAAASETQASAPFTVEVAASGRALCRTCGEAIAKGSPKACVSAWAKGGRISANHHLDCFVRSWKVEATPSNRGKCKHSGRSFTKGAPRVGYATTSGTETAWVCLESAASLLPTIAPQSSSWGARKLAGFDELPTEELKTLVEHAFGSEPRLCTVEADRPLQPGVR